MKRDVMELHRDRQSKILIPFFNYKKTKTTKQTQNIMMRVTLKSFS